MATVLKFYNHGRAISGGVAVAVQWNKVKDDYIHYKTDSAGCVYVDESVFLGQERLAETIYVVNPLGGGYARQYRDYVIRRGGVHTLDLDDAIRF